jgi:hypothetical protein
MTVKEMIDNLSQYPPEMEIMGQADGCSRCSIHEISEVRLYKTYYEDPNPAKLIVEVS